jgi:hypothetical protein
MAKAEKVKKIGRADRPQYPKWVDDPKAGKDKNGLPLKVKVNDADEEAALTGTKPAKAKANPQGQNAGWGQ